MDHVAVCIRSSLEHSSTSAWHRPPPHDGTDADSGFCKHLPDSRSTALGSAQARVKWARDERPLPDCGKTWIYTKHRWNLPEWPRCLNSFRMLKKAVQQGSSE